MNIVRDSLLLAANVCMAFSAAAAMTSELVLIDLPVVYKVDLEPPANSVIFKGAAPKACSVSQWQHPYLAVDALLIQEKDVAWGKELRTFKGRILAESRFSSPAQVEQLLTIYRAALEGDSAAMAEIGNRYYDGLGLPNDFKSSLTWYRKAAEFGSPYAMYVLSELYGEGWIVQQDPLVSARWVIRANAQPNALLGIRQLGLRYADRERGAYRLDKAFFWIQRAASRDDVPSQLWMGDYYADTEHLDGMLALNWYGKAAAAKEPQAYYGIGELYETGRGIPVDYAQAARWYEKAARIGLNAAQYRLGMFYAYGIGLPLDPIRAWAWLEISRTRGDNPQVDQLQHILISEMLPEQRLYAADLATEFALLYTGDRSVHLAQKEKKVAPKKVVHLPARKPQPIEVIEEIDVIDVVDITEIRD